LNRSNYSCIANCFLKIFFDLKSIFFYFFIFNINKSKLSENIKIIINLIFFQAKYNFKIQLNIILKIKINGVENIKIMLKNNNI